MNEKLKEIKDFINSTEYYGDLDDFLDEYGDNEIFKDINAKFVKNIDSDEHRWYFIYTNVYNFTQNGEDIGDLAICEVGSLKSESMTREDAYVNIEAYSCKEIQTTSYEIVE